MDFFGAQDNARRKTKLLVALFCVAVALIVISIYALFALIFLDLPESASLTDFFEPMLFAWVAGGTVAIIGGASAFKMVSLRSGGTAVAQSLGAREVSLATKDPLERRLINVVEEMSIASGVPMPPVFIIEEPSVNAFAAGFSIHDAAVAVTRGALEQLSRDELQGVMAHEFSHILNGDMRLNIRLIGPLFGLLVIAFLGRAAVRGSIYRGSGRNSKGGGAVVFIGFALMAIGYIGVLFGRLIQAAISRQREFLADSAAVQFTRNPDGIAGALKRIGFRGVGSKISHAHAEDTAHLFFSKALSGGFATHPPLAARIKAIDANWDGKFLPSRARPDSSNEPAKAPYPRPVAADAGRVFGGGAAAIAMMGQLTENNIRRAVKERIAIHHALGRFLEEPEAARHLVYALMLDDDEQMRKQQLDFIPSLNADLDVELIREAAVAVNGWHPSRRVETLGLLASTLKRLPADRLRKIPANLRRLAESNGSLSLREFLIIRVVSNEIHIARSPAGRSLSNDPGRFAKPMGTLLAFLAFLDSEEVAVAEKDFAAAVSQQSDLAGQPLFPSTRPRVEDLEIAFDEMLGMSFALRKAVLTAAAHIILTDGAVSEEEWRALRLTALALDCPMPELAPE
jgi:Zn-dependent protease with chaperone function